MNPRLVIYERKDPFQEGVTHIAIQTETTPNYVWATYFGANSVPRLPSDFVIVPITFAGQYYNFQRGKISDCKFSRK